MTLFKWSQTAANNATADTTCPFPENMAASAYNDGMRGAMSAVAKYRDDTAGLIVTAGTNTAFTVFSFQGFDTLAHLHGQEIWFTPHTTNAAGPNFLNVDGLGSKPLRSAPGVELLAATIIQGTPYSAVYNNTDGAFYLRGLFGNPFNVPFLGGMDCWDTIAPNTAFIFPVGQALSRTVYAAAFARWGTTFGAGDGSTTFNVPDKRGRVSAALDNMGGVTANRLVAGSMAGARHTMGGVGGLDTTTLATANLPAQSLSNGGGGISVNISAASTGVSFAFTTTGLGSGGNHVDSDTANGTRNIPLGGSISASFTGNPFTGQNATPIDNLPPIILCNYVIRVL